MTELHIKRFMQQLRILQQMRPKLTITPLCESQQRVNESTEYVRHYTALKNAAIAVRYQFRLLQGSLTPSISNDEHQTLLNLLNTMVEEIPLFDEESLGDNCKTLQRHIQHLPESDKLKSSFSEICTSFLSLKTEVSTFFLHVADAKQQPSPHRQTKLLTLITPNLGFKVGAHKHSPTRQQIGFFGKNHQCDGLEIRTNGSKLFGRFIHHELQRGLRIATDGRIEKGEFERGILVAGSIAYPDGSRKVGLFQNGLLILGLIDKPSENKSLLGLLSQKKLLYGRLTAGKTVCQGSWSDCHKRHGAMVVATPTKEHFYHYVFDGEISRQASGSPDARAFKETIEGQLSDLSALLQQLCSQIDSSIEQLSEKLGAFIFTELYEAESEHVNKLFALRQQLDLHTLLKPNSNEPHSADQTFNESSELSFDYFEKSFG